MKHAVSTQHTYRPSVPRHAADIGRQAFCEVAVINGKEVQMVGRISAGYRTDVAEAIRQLRDLADQLEADWGKPDYPKTGTLDPLFGSMAIQPEPGANPPPGRSHLTLMLSPDGSHAILAPDGQLKIVYPDARTEAQRNHFFNSIILSSQHTKALVCWLWGRV